MPESLGYRDVADLPFDADEMMQALGYVRAEDGNWSKDDVDSMIALVNEGGLAWAGYQLARLRSSSAI